VDLPVTLTSFIGRERLLATGVAATAHLRHAASYLALAEQAEADGSRPRQRHGRNASRSTSRTLALLWTG
jgi:hypothetical protein